MMGEMLLRFRGRQRPVCRRWTAAELRLCQLPGDERRATAIEVGTEGLGSVSTVRVNVYLCTFLYVLRVEYG